MEPVAKPLKPLYFHLKSIPKCSFYEYDELTKNYSWGEEEIHELETMYPKSLLVPEDKFGSNGYHIRTQPSTLITIICTDPNASLELNALKIHLGAGTFTLPTIVMGAVTLRLFHRGPATIEYRSFVWELIVDLQLVSFNVVCLDMKQEEIVAGVLHQAFVKIDNPLTPNRTRKTYVQNLEAPISRLKRAGLLHDDPV